MATASVSSAGDAPTFAPIIKLVRSPVPVSKSIFEIFTEAPPPGWERVIEAGRLELQLVSQILQQLGDFYPPKHQVLYALDVCSLKKVKVVILGQDPYHGPKQANGMSFSVNRGVTPPPSLANFFTELEQEYSQSEYQKVYQNYLVNRNHLRTHYSFGVDAELEAIWRDEAGYTIEQSQALRQKSALNVALRAATSMSEEQIRVFTQMTDDELKSYVARICPVFQRPGHGDLTSWGEQGVLLLNACLTVKPHEPGSHKQIWNGVITRALDAIAEENPECIFLLLGKKAQDFGLKLGQRAIRLVASHPSPLSAYKGSRDAPAFIGSGLFKQVNEILVKQGKTPIDWRLPG